MKTIVAPNRIETEEFALAFGDKNPIHKADHERQIVPGDWSVYRYLRELGYAPIGHTRFNFQSMILPEEGLSIDTYGIRKGDKYALKVDRECLNGHTPQVMPISSSLEVRGDYSGLLEDNEPVLADLIANYCLTSGDLAGGIFHEAFPRHRLGVDEERSLVIYKGAELCVLPEMFSLEGTLERRLGEPEVTANFEKRRAEATFPFVLLDSADGKPVGYMKKTVVCMKLNPIN